MIDPRRFKGAWALAVVVVLGLAVRVVSSGQGALDRGSALLERGEELGATVALREAVSWYLPGAGWRDEAASTLWALHEAQVDAGRLGDGVRTLNALRSGLYSARSLLHPDEERLEQVDARLATLMARWEVTEAEAEGRPIPGELAEREGHFAELLARPTRPSRAWGLVAVLGFGLWVGAAWSASRADGAGRWRRLAWSALGLVGFLGGVALA